MQLHFRHWRSLLDSFRLIHLREIKRSGKRYFGVFVGPKTHTLLELTIFSRPISAQQHLGSSVSGLWVVGHLTQFSTVAKDHFWKLPAHMVKKGAVFRRIRRFSALFSPPRARPSENESRKRNFRLTWSGRWSGIAAFTRLKIVVIALFDVISCSP